MTFKHSWWAMALMLAIGVTTARSEENNPEPTSRSEWKFVFGPGPAPEGSVRVSPETLYTKETGYGFEPGAKLVEVEQGGNDPLHAGHCTSDKPFFFSAAVPEGNYRVTLTLGDRIAESTTTIKAELRRLMVEQLHTAAGEFQTLSFIVNVRTPNYPGGKVHLKSPRETTDEAWAWDEKLTLEFNGRHPCLCALSIAPVEVPTIYILGDSTVCDQSKEPFASWGQMLPRFFKPDIAVANHAESGETLGGSQNAHRLDKVLSLLKPGDYVLIQFGHNDMKSKDPNAPQIYKATLKRWAVQVKARGATAVVITPVNRHSFQGETVTNSLREYPAMAREAALEEGVALIDLNAMSKTLYETLGATPSIQLFEHNADLSKFDGTHHSPYGAYELARCVIEGLRQADIKLARHVLEIPPPFDPARPDAAADFKVPASPGMTGLRPLGD